jgi:UPF0176 protein
MIVIATFYKFNPFPEYEAQRAPLRALCRETRVKGSILFAAEGVNGTIAGKRSGIDRVIAHIRSLPGFSDLEPRESYSNTPPFKRMKVRLKRELITLGDPTVDPGERVGTYVEPKLWNALVDDPEVVLVDTRNSFEVAVGTFEGAVDPQTASFTEFPDYVARHLDPKKHKKVALFCTGGIRCEKATSYMLRQGFEEVYHLKGGILKYLEEVPAERSKWQGECYVFDERVTVDHRLKPGSYEACHGCGRPLSEEDLASPVYEPGVSCPHCHATQTSEQRARFRERQRQIELAEQRNTVHIGE